MVDNTAMQSGRYKAYPEYKDSGVEWLGDIPSGWSVRRVKEIANVISGYPFDSKKFDPLKGTPLIRIRDIRSLHTEVYFDGHVPKEALIKNGDVLIGMDGDFNVAKWHGGEAALNQRVACVRHDNVDLQQFLYYVMPFNMKVVNDLTYYTTVKHLSVTDILKTKFSLPPHNELQNIISFLDHETAKIDTLIEKQQRLIKLLTEKRQAVISHAVTKGLNPDVPMKESGVEWLGDVPEHWKVGRTGYYGNVLNGSTPSKANESYWYPKEIAWLSSGSVNQYHVIEASDFISKKALKECSVSILPKGTLIMGMIGQGKTRGMSAVTEIEATINQNIAAVIPSVELNSNYGHLFFQAAYKVLREDARGGNQAALNCDIIKDFKITIPPLEEQISIFKTVEAILKIFDSLIEKCEQAIGLMQERRTALISAAVTGKIDVRDWTADS